MKNHHGENWPYHESRNGDMVACASNPCRIHSGSDIIATSPEEAHEKKYESSEAMKIKIVFIIMRLAMIALYALIVFGMFTFQNIGIIEPPIPPTPLWSSNPVLPL